MRAPGLCATLAIVVSLGGPGLPARADDRSTPRPGTDRLELAVHYDFFLCEGVGRMTPPERSTTARSSTARSSRGGAATRSGSTERG